MWEQVQRVFVVICLTSIVVSPVGACNTPVFRYALQQWEPDAFDVVVLHREPLDDQHTQLVQHLEAAAADLDSPANLIVRTIDVRQLTDETTKLLDSAGSPQQFPWMLVHFPVGTNTSRPAYSGLLDESSVHALVDSPARREIVRRIGAGESAVWILVEVGDQEKDDAAEQMLLERLKHLEATLELPDGDDDSVDELFPPDDSASEPPIDDLQLNFSLLRVSRADSEERVFVSMLLGTESDLLEYEEPIAIPIFGRGRACFALVGRGITEENIDTTCEFISGACSCEVKSQNPGADLLFRANWDLLAGGDDSSEHLLPELTSLAAMPVVEEAALENSPSTSLPTPVKTPEPVARSSPESTPVTTMPEMNASRSTLLVPIFGILMFGLLVVVVGTLVITIRR